MVGYFWLLGIRLVIARLVLIFVLPLDFHGRLRVIRTMFLPGALHGIEVSILADTSLRKLRAYVGLYGPLANTGAVLSLLDGPSGCDPAFCVVWFRFRTLRRCLAYRPGEVHRAYRLIDGAADGCPGHGLRICLWRVLLRLGFSGIPVRLEGRSLTRR